MSELKADRVRRIFKRNSNLANLVSGKKTKGWEKWVYYAPDPLDQLERLLKTESYWNVEPLIRS